MPFWLLDTLLTAPQSVLFAVSAQLALRPRRPWLFAATFSLCQPLLYLLLRHLFPVPYWVGSLLLIAAALAVPMLFCRDKASQCVVFFLLAFSVMLFAEFLTGLIAYLLFPVGFHYSAEAVNQHLPAYKLLYLVLLFLLLVLLLRLWERATRRTAQHDPFQRLLLVPFFFSQAGFLLVLMYLLITDQLLHRESVLLALAAGLFFLLSNAALYISVMGLLRRRQEQQRKEALLQAMENQFSSFQQMIRQEESHSKLRHDLNNQLQTIYALFAAGQREQAVQHFHRLTDLTFQKNPPFFCAEPTINAILWQKSTLCREADIALDAAVALPPDFSMNPLVLCSLFGNLLDNAIHACQGAPAGEGRIRLRVSREAGFLLVSCENTVHVPPPERENRRHWGMQILEEIAAMYGGTMEVRRAADRFQVWISLQINQEPRYDHGNHHHL